MRISEEWLREWVPGAPEAARLAEQLSMAGLEVDAVAPAAPEFSGVVVGAVLEVQPHPNADRLRVCRVDVAKDEPLDIVCGAANVRAGLRVAAALVGARLPGGMKIKAAKLRGVASAGMLCSEQELGMAERSEGLLELPGDAPVGADVRTYLKLADPIIEVDLTPNRGDCLSMLGMAREVGVLNRLALQRPAMAPVPVQSAARWPVTVAAPSACPRYLGRVVQGVDGTAETPLWMRERLRRAGVRSLGPLVDVTNYVMLELGQPMHAFDLARLTQGIWVRWAQAGERLTLLDGKEVELRDDTLVIADGVQALALAGVMGGAASGVSAQTRDVFLECAFFNPVDIAGRARSYGLVTDSSHRFERGVNPAQLEEVMERATGLLLAIAGGEAGPVVEAGAPEHVPAVGAIGLRQARLNRLLGADIPRADVEDILTRLEMRLAPDAEGWLVTPPAFRFDIALEVDLVEEIARVYGYDALPTRLPRADMCMLGQPETRLSAAQMRQTLVAQGYQEVVTYSFISAQDQALLDPGTTAVTLQNPISAAMGVMRTTLWPGLLRTVQFNLHRQQRRLRLFELGLRFYLQDGEIKQENVLGGALTGDRYTEQWGQAERSTVDFFDLKAAVDAVLGLTRRAAEFTVEPASHPALQPGQCATVVHNGRQLGWLGAVHPRVLQAMDVEQAVFVFELASAALLEVQVPEFRALSKFPSVRRDLSVVVDEAVSARQIRDAVWASLGDLLQNFLIFDVYRGKGVDSGRKSLSLGLILQESSRTLTESETTAAIRRVVEKLEQELGATLRE